LNRSSRDVEKRVIEMHFDGVPRDTIAHQLGVPPATVTEILTVLPPGLKPLRDLSKDLRKNNMIAHDALQGVRLLHEFRALGIEPNQFYSSIQAVAKMSKEAGYEPEAVFQAGATLSELEAQSGKPYPEAIREFEIVNAKTKKKKQQNMKFAALNSQLRAQIRENEERLSQKFKAANESPEEISKFKEQKKKLELHGINLGDINTINKLLENVEETGNDADRVVTLVKSVGSLQKTSTSLQNTTRNMSKLLANQSSQKENIEQEISQKRHKNSLLDNEIESKQVYLGSLDYQLELRNSQLWIINDNYKKINAMRKETIAQTGRMLGMNENQIIDLQLSKQLDLTLKVLQKQVIDFLKRN
jgi:hypothetical protein